MLFYSNECCKSLNRCEVTMDFKHTKIDNCVCRWHFMWIMFRIENHSDSHLTTIIALIMKFSMEKMKRAKKNRPRKWYSQKGPLRMCMIADPIQFSSFFSPLQATKKKRIDNVGNFYVYSSICAPCSGLWRSWKIPKKKRSNRWPNRSKEKCMIASMKMWWVLQQKKN